MRVKVSLMGDVCLPQPAGMTVHNGVSPPPPIYPPGSPLRCFESPIPMMWPPGMALQQNRLTTTVFHKTQFVVLEGHDCGYAIPHITIPPANLKLPLIITFSKRKVMFSSSKVKADGAQIGCSEFAGPPVSLPMLCCASPVSLPIGFPSFNGLHTVSVGLSSGDVAAGFLAIACNVLGSLVCRLEEFKGGYQDLTRELLGAANWKEWGFKTALGCLSGASKVALTGEGKVLRVEIGSGFAGLRVSSKAPSNGGSKVDGEYQVGPMQVGLAHTESPEGTTSEQSTLSVGFPVGTDSSRVNETHDCNGLPAKQITQTTTTLGADGQATSTTVSYRGSSSPAENWGTPL
ncbi:MAG TPA: hypothetical protein VJ860_02335 [Polyangia bacterium]|jgi:hypothetical protein|nr:hypothetical protein [Polyangia bacterium]